LLPSAGFAAGKASSNSGQTNKTIQEQKQIDKQTLLTETQDAKTAARELAQEEKRETQAEKRAAVKEKVAAHKAIQFASITARKEANGSDKTPAYQKMIDWLAGLLDF
jgi:hypothetical protein